MAYFSAYFRFPFPCGWFGLASLVSWASQALGQLQNNNDIDKWLFGNGIAVNAACRKADSRLFLGDAALKAHGILQLTLDFLCDGGCVCRCGIGAAFLPNVTEDRLQIVGKRIAEIVIFPYLGRLQSNRGNIAGTADGILKKFRKKSFRPVDFSIWMYYILFGTNDLNRGG